MQVHASVIRNCSHRRKECHPQQAGKLEGCGMNLHISAVSLAVCLHL
jgi:hypothetical protein